MTGRVPYNKRGHNFLGTTLDATNSAINSSTNTPVFTECVPLTTETSFHAKLFQYPTSRAIQVVETETDDESTVVAQTVDVVFNPVEYDFNAVGHNTADDYSSDWIPTFTVCPDNLPLAEMERMREYYGVATFKTMLSNHNYCPNCYYTKPDASAVDTFTPEFSSANGYEIKTDAEYSDVAHIRYPFTAESLDREHLCTLATYGLPWTVRSVRSDSLINPYLLTDSTTGTEYVVYQ